MTIEIEYTKLETYVAILNNLMSKYGSCKVIHIEHICSPTLIKGLRNPYKILLMSDNGSVYTEYLPCYIRVNEGTKYEF